MPPALSNKPENFSQNVAATNRWAIQMEGQLAALQKGQNNAPNVIAKTVAQLPPTVSTQTVELQVPGSIFTPADQVETGSPIKLEFELLPEPPNTVFAGPAVVNTPLDKLSGSVGGSTDPVNIPPTTPGVKNEFAFLFAATQGQGPTLPNPGSAWSQLPSNGNIFTTIYTQFLSTVAPVSVVQPAVGSPFAAIMALLGTNGKPPALAQAFVQQTGITSPVSTSNFASPVTAGNTIIVAVSCDNVTSTASGVVTDTLGNKYILLESLQSSPNTNNQALLYVCANILGGTNAITFTYTGGPVVNLTAMEYTNITAAPGIPSFRSLVEDDLPPITFDAIGSGTNATATMHVGSGASLDATGTGTIDATAVGGITVTGTPTSGQVLTATSGSAADWQTPSGGGGGATGANILPIGNPVSTDHTFSGSSELIRIPYNLLTATATKLKITWSISSGQQNVGAAVLRTLPPGSNTFDAGSTVITWSGSATPTFNAPSDNQSDAITFTVDGTKDIAVIIFFSASTADISPTYANPFGVNWGFASGDKTAVSTYPSITGGALDNAGFSQIVSA